MFVKKGQRVVIDDLDHAVSVYRVEYLGELGHRQIQGNVDKGELEHRRSEWLCGVKVDALLNPILTFFQTA